MLGGDRVRIVVSALWYTPRANLYCAGVVL